MRSHCPLFLLALIFIVTGCRKQDHTHRDPCNDSTYLALSTSKEVLPPADRERLGQLEQECEEYQIAEENRGKLWPYILGGIAILAGALYVILSLVIEDDVIID